MEYVEVRLMDLNPFETLGISAATARFLDVFLLHCLLTDSPPDTPEEIAELSRNQHRTAATGRDPALLLERAGAQVKLTDWGHEVLAGCEPIAHAMDQAMGGTAYTEAWRAAWAALSAPEQLPSARVLQAVQATQGQSFKNFVAEQSHSTRDAFLMQPYPDALRDRYDHMAVASMEEQRRIERSDTMPFEEYRRQYVSPERLGLRPGAVMVGAESP